MSFQFFTEDNIEGIEEGDKPDKNAHLQKNGQKKDEEKIEEE